MQLPFFLGRVTTRGFSSIKRKGNWESVVGLEVHAQIASDSKLFSKGDTSFGAPVNTLVSFFDASLPGTLPMLNKKCVEAAVLTAMALSCKINPISWFDRKHYFYSDLPAGYQITQQRKAIANNGELNFVVYNPSIHKQPYHKKCKILQIQLEQDSGKSLHVPSGNRSLIDLNRAGIGLIELVFEPNLADGEEAGAMVKELCLILERLGTCTCKMEEGALRVDANVSVNRKGEPLGTRSEVKNLSSIRSLVNAIEYEVERQIIELEHGRPVVNETRGYDALSKVTIPMRDKEVKQDYRFMPEPNLPPLKLSTEEELGKVNISALRSQLVELPDATRDRLISTFGLKVETALVIVNTRGLCHFFESVMSRIDSKLGVRTANFISGEILQELNKESKTVDECSLDPSKIGELMTMLDSGVVNFSKASDVLKLLMKGDTRSPVTIVQDEGWLQVTDLQAIRVACEEVLKENANLVTKFKSSGKQKYINQLIGKVRVKTQGKYDMKKVTDIVQELLKNS